MIETRVTLDSIIGPYDCLATETGRAPSFTLDVVREVSAGLLSMADDWGYTTVITVHVIDGHAGSPDTVHVFDSGETYCINEWGDRAPLAVAVRVSWGGKVPTVTKIPVNRETRRAARKTQKKMRARRGAAPRAAVITVNWQWVHEEGSGVVDAVKPLDDGRYPLGGYEWPWDLVAWECVCGYEQGWHETDCLCGLTRDNQPEGLAAAAHVAGVKLRALAPEATSALVDLTGLGRIVAVHAGDREIDTADDTGPFDTETLGAADEVLRAALDGAEPGDLAPAGWEHVPDPDSDQVYRITFTAPQQ